MVGGCFARRVGVLDDEGGLVMSCVVMLEVEKVVGFYSATLYVGRSTLT